MKKAVGIIFLMISTIAILIYNKNLNNQILDEVSLKKVEQEKGMFAIMLQEVAGEDKYIQSNDEMWPTAGYEINSTKSGCIDSDGQKIENVEISYDDKTNKIKTEVDSSSYCYIYFDKKAPKVSEQLIEKKDNYLKETNMGDLQYRYVGTQDEDIAGKINNYVCFGKDKCENETDDNMYRIIGITSDGRIKIQKNKIIGTSKWGSDSRINISWQDSLIYTSTLKSFYNNTNYVSQTMKDKIEEHIWNTGDVGTGKYSNGTDVYNAEQTINSHKSNYGLAYLSDYYFAYNEGGKQNCNTGVYCKSWMVLSYNSLVYSQLYEWTMTRWGSAQGGTFYYAWSVHYTGNVASFAFDDTAYAVRPVFYLTSDVTITGGDGTSTNPYILK